VKVRVPKELRPPAIEFTETEDGTTKGLRFRCVKFRIPLHGEFYYIPLIDRPGRGKGYAVTAYCRDYETPRVILEKVS
jgi:hypothetical protein